MTGPAPLLGVVDLTPDTGSSALHDETGWVRRQACGDAAVYDELRLVVSASFQAYRRGLLIAASPACEADRCMLQRFADDWSRGRASALDVVECHTLTCSVVLCLPGSLVLFRDRLGVDGLHYRPGSGRLAFSSDPAPLFDGRADVGDVDTASVLTYLLSGRARLGHTFFTGVKTVPSAHFVRCPDGPMHAERYWSPLGNPMPVDSREERADRFRARLDQAGSAAFAPSGNALLLSGGIDSSYLAYLAARTRPEGTVCYTVTYAGGRYPDEYRYARVVADAFGLPLERVELTVSDSVRHLRTILDEPRPVSAWATICSNALVEAAVADGNPHVLSGLGADEVLANYRKILTYYLKVRTLVMSLDPGRPDLLDHVAPDDDVLFPGVADFFGRDDLGAILCPGHDTKSVADDLRQFYRECGPVDRTAHLFSYFVAHECQHRLPDALIRDFESHARRNGTHIGFPFLDARLVEYGCSLYPTERFQVRGDTWRSKVTMKAIASAVVPDEIVTRERGSFDFPFRRYLGNDEFRDVVLDELTDSGFWDSGLVEPHVLPRYVDVVRRERAGETVDPRRWPELWVLLTLCAWFRRYA